VILENENLCSIIAEDVSIKSTLREYETLRSGLSKHPDVTEAEELKDKDLLRTKHYTYTKTDGTFLMRVSNSYPLGRSGKGSFILSVVSGARK